jgi:hypothetical protein
MAEGLRGMRLTMLRRRCTRRRSAAERPQRTVRLALRLQMQLFRIRLLYDCEMTQVAVDLFRPTQ